MNAIKFFTGQRTAAGAVVTVDGEPLRTRTETVFHAAGFDWGHNGSAAAQLAFALLADVYDVATARLVYLQFRAEVIAKFGRDHWLLNSHQVQQWFEWTAVAAADDEEIEGALAELA